MSESISNWSISCIVYSVYAQHLDLVQSLLTHYGLKTDFLWFKSQKLKKSKVLDLYLAIFSELDTIYGTYFL